MIELILSNRPTARRIMGEDYHRYCEENIEEIIIKGFVFDRTNNAEDAYWYDFETDISICIEENGKYFLGVWYNDYSLIGNFDNKKDVRSLKEAILFQVSQILEND